MLFNPPTPTFNVTPCHKDPELLPVTEGGYWFLSWCKPFQPANAVAAFLGSLKGTEQLATNVTLFRHFVIPLIIQRG